MYGGGVIAATYMHQVKKGNMKLDNILEYIKQQGFSIFILCCAIYWFNAKHNANEKRIDELNVYIRTEFKTVIEKNTEALNRINTNK